MHTSPLERPGEGNAGGMNVYVDDLATSLNRRGIGVVVFTRRVRPEQEPRTVAPTGYEVRHVKAGPLQELALAELGGHAQGFAAGVTASLNREGLAHDSFDLIHSHYWLSGWSGLAVKQDTGLPLVNSFHTLGRVKDATRRPDQPSEPLLRIAAESEVIAGSDCVIASTDDEALELIDRYGADPGRVCVNPPGIDLSTFRPGDRRAARRVLGWDDVPTVLFVGRIQPLKGLDVAVEAFGAVQKQLGNARLAIVGGPSGPSGEEERQRIRRMVEQLGLVNSVRWVGVQPHAMMPHCYQAADVLIVPSRSESFGLVAAEAQAVGLPVVASNVGGLRHIVVDGRSGSLVEGWDPSSYGQALLDILAAGSERDRFTESALASGRRFGWEAATDRLLELYQGVADGPV